MYWNDKIMNLFRRMKIKRELTEAERFAIQIKSKEGKLVRVIGQELGISKSTVYDNIVHFKKHKTSVSQPRVGRT